MRALALIAALLSATLAHAQTYAFRGGPGVQMTTGASRPTTIAGRRTIWVDSSNRLRFYNGTDDTYPAAIAATTKGDLAAYTGSAWSRLAAGSNGLCLVTDSGEATGLKWAACAASTGYQTVQDEATPLTQRTTINFTGAGVSCVDSGGKTVCTISGGGSSTLATAYSNGASQTDSTIGLDSTRLGVRIRDNATPISGSLFAIQNSAGSVNILSATKTGTTLGQVGQTSGTASAALKVALASHTGQTASTERVGVDIDLSATNQWATGAITTQRDMVIRGPTYSFAGASTVTDAATLAITTAPFAGTNATITNAWSLWVQDGATLMQNNSVGATVGYAGLVVENRVNATVGAQKYSPAIVLSGAGWKTNATAASQTVRFALQTIPVQGTAAPTGGLSIQSSINGGAWAESLNVGTTAITASVPIVPSFTTTTVAPSWSTVTYQNSWDDYSGSLTTRYTKDAQGIVTLLIAMKTGSNGTVSFNMPAGYRPSQTVIQTGSTLAGAIAICELATDGDLTTDVSSTSGSFFRLTYYAEN